MATLDSLKDQLRQEVTALGRSPAQKLSDTQYCDGFDILLQGSGWSVYQDFIIPKLSHVLAPLLASRDTMSVLEVGPGPKSVLGYIPSFIRRGIGRYTAFEPNNLFASKLRDSLSPLADVQSPLPCLQRPPEIHQVPFDQSSTKIVGDKQFNVILFCHSMYGMKFQNEIIKHALEMLVEQPDDGIIVVFHRDGTLKLDGLICHQTWSFPTGITSVLDDNESLDYFSRFIAGFVLEDDDVEKAMRLKWRHVCRTLGRPEGDRLLFNSPNVMAVFTRHATKLAELSALIPGVRGETTVKNREARVHVPALVIKPTGIHHVQQCVAWALKHKVGLTVIGGGHSGQCLWPNVVAVDMGAFDQVHVCDSLVVVEAGCKTGKIIGDTLAAGLTVPLGARPSVGAGLWLQGGIGHLARQHGLACDSIVGAIVVSVESGRIICLGSVPSQHRPVDAVVPQNEVDLLWAVKGAGTNFGIVVSVTIQAYAAQHFLVRNWIIPVKDNVEARIRLGDINQSVSTVLPRNCSLDAYLYGNADQLQLGVTMFETSPPGSTFEAVAHAALGPEDGSQVVDSVGLFESDMYVSGMHGGHGKGKTSSFKRCIFLRSIGAEHVIDMLVAAVETRPLPLCYLHLLHGGGAVGHVASSATAFGCRDWSYACVITGVWPRGQDGTDVSRAVVQWVYKVAQDLLPFSSGAYSADLGPDPRDARLAAKAFGPNIVRLARLKQAADPHNVLAYACPLPTPLERQKIVILVTGKCGAGKDFCADIWASIFTDKSIRARVASISDATKKEYATASGADVERLLWDRDYKELHRPTLTTFFQDQVRKRPQLPQEHFLNIVNEATDVDVLFITGMRDEAPVVTFWPMVSDVRLLEVHVQAGDVERLSRRGTDCDSTNGESVPSHRPNLIFNNDTDGNDKAREFAQRRLLPLVHDDLERLGAMVRSVQDFPRPGIEFRHVLGIAQEPGGLDLCTSLLQSHFTGSWADVDVVACCEAGGYVFASPLAAQVNVPLVLIREAGKLPAPVHSVTKLSSHVSLHVTGQKVMEMSQDAVPKGAAVVIVDDVLATGETLVAVLTLFEKAGVSAEYISVIIVAEFPIHRGRDLLRQRGFGQTKVQSILIFSGH